jgi:uncharacterized protein YutE (UPF0331/DUF86 family)
VSDVQQNLLKTLEQLDASVHWLERSFKKCSEIGLKKNYSDDEYDAFETLSGRFARTADLIFSKVFRSIDVFEMSDGGTLIDAVNRAEKRGIVDGIEQVRMLRNLRNEIVHEYVPEDFKNIFDELLELTPNVLKIAENCKQYCKKYF